MPDNKSVELSDAAFLVLWCARQGWVYWHDEGYYAPAGGSISPDRGKGTRAVLRVPVVKKLIGQGLAEKSSVWLQPTAAGIALLDAETRRTVDAGVGHKPRVVEKAAGEVANA
jgi:hypothetical protein